jgi:hypothetical protein
VGRVAPAQVPPRVGWRPARGPARAARPVACRRAVDSARMGRRVQRGIDVPCERCQRQRVYRGGRTVRRAGRDIQLRVSGRTESSRSGDQVSAPSIGRGWDIESGTALAPQASSRRLRAGHERQRVCGSSARRELALSAGASASWFG